MCVQYVPACVPPRVVVLCFCCLQQDIESGTTSRIPALSISSSVSLIRFSVAGTHGACYISFQDFIFHSCKDILTQREIHAYRQMHACSTFFFLLHKKIIGGKNIYYPQKFAYFTIFNLLLTGSNLWFEDTFFTMVHISITAACI